MYSGGDSSGDGVNSRNQFNWQMTSQTSCNVNSGSIDWASLAQQWIQMKDSGAAVPDAPPPPTIGDQAKLSKATKFDEQGEADMEVEKEDEMQFIGFGQQNSAQVNHSSWFTTQPDPTAFCATQGNQWAPWPPRVALPPPVLHVPITTGSLTPPIPKDNVNTTVPLQVGGPKTPSEAASLLPSKESLEPPPMDAAKRKILPAWIREGLEKMEREKLKQLERDQKDRDPLTAGTAAAADSDINNKFKSMVKSSTTEMEGESSGNEADDIAAADASAPYDDIDEDAIDTIGASHVPVPASIEQRERINSGKTYEERISEMMIAVRKTLTELLLEVTNEEISSIAHEAIRKRRAKASSAQVIRKSAIPSITGKLGLEAYADSDSDSASDDEATNDDSKRSDEENDSEEELKTNIRICKRTFAKTIEEIEERIAASAVREEHLLKEHQKRDAKDNHNNHYHHGTDYNRSPVRKTKGFDPEIGEPQPDKKSNTNGKRRKERTSRFSDNKDSRHRIATSYYAPSSMGSGNLPSSVMPGVPSAMPPSSFPLTKLKTANNTVSSSLPPAHSANEKRSSSSANKLSSKPPSTSSSSKNHHHHRPSDSASSSSDSSSSGDTRSSHSRRSSKYTSSRNKRSSRERSKRSYRSSSHRSSRRRDSSDSNDDDHYKKRSKHHRSHKSGGGSSSTYTRKHDRRRSESRSSRSRTRSRSRSRSTTYSSSRRDARY